jgi:hypothetical protein
MVMINFTKQITVLVLAQKQKHPKVIEWNTSGAEQINSRMQRKAKKFSLYEFQKTPSMQ